MKFLDAVDRSPALGKGKPGLQGLEGRHRRLIGAKDTPQIRGSLDLEKALLEIPGRDDQRLWDYGIGYGPVADHAAYWVEVHPVSSSEVKVMIEKLKSLQEFLKNEAPDLEQLTRRYRGQAFQWVRTSDGQILSDSLRRLAQAGLTGPQSVATLR